MCRIVWISTKNVLMRENAKIFLHIYFLHRFYDALFLLSIEMDTHARRMYLFTRNYINSTNLPGSVKVEV